MTIAGWAFLAVAWTVITAVLVYCYRLILTKNTLREEAETQADKPGPFSM